MWRSSKRQILLIIVSPIFYEQTGAYAIKERDRRYLSFIARVSARVNARYARNEKKSGQMRWLADQLAAGLTEPISIMDEIKAVIDEHGGWPAAFQAAR